MADRVEITVLVDNYMDIFVPPTTVSTSPTPGIGGNLWAEHGLSLMVKAGKGDDSRTILLDFGRSGNVFVQNTTVLDVDFKAVDAMVLSHGHRDHFGGLGHAFARTGADCALVTHPGAFGRKRYMQLENGTRHYHWNVDSPEERLFSESASRIRTETGPADLGLGAVLSGQIERNSAFETHRLNAYVEERGEQIRDVLADDQSLYVELEGKGIVVVTGCCHAGVVNTLEQAGHLFPGQNIYALIGGLHLCQADPSRMDQTLDYLAHSGIRFMAGMHCTGYFAKNRLMDAFPKAWIPTTVGTKITL